MNVKKRTMLLGVIVAVNAIMSILSRSVAREANNLTTV